MATGTLIFWLATAYAACGSVVAVAFLSFGLDKVEHSARGAYAFRPLLVPGLIVLWPIVLVRWRQRLHEKDTG